MPFNLLLLPLLGGFIFVRNWERSRYYALRSDGHVLLFYSASAGVACLFLASLITALFGNTFDWIDRTWHEEVPFEHSGKAFLAFLIGTCSPKLLNIFYDKEKEIDRVVRAKQNTLELLLRTAMGQRKLIALSVKSGKYYVGYIVSNISPAYPVDYLEMIPLISGYRNKDQKVVHFTTRYTEAYSRIEEEIRERVTEEAREVGVTPAEMEEWIREDIDEKLSNFKIVIPVREIESANIFELDTYEKYFKHS